MTGVQTCALPICLYNNIFLGTMTAPSTQYFQGTAFYNGYPSTLEEYIELVKKHGKGDVEYFMREKQPVYIADNYYGDGVEAYEKENGALLSTVASEVKVLEEEDGLYLAITLDEAFDAMTAKVIDSDLLGRPRLVEERFEKPDGSTVTVDTDMLGNVRSANPTAGPIESLKAGKNRIKIWNK